MPGRLLIASVLAAAVVSQPARAHDEVIFTGEVGTLFPLQVDGRLRFRIPNGLFFGGGAGWLPGAYVDVINDFATAYDAYDDDTARLLGDSLDDSLVLDATIGWDPGGFGGFRVAGHYSYATLGGETSTRALLEATTGITIPPQVVGQDLPIRSRVHMLGVSVGLVWELGLGHIGAELAVRFPIAARSFIDTDEQGAQVNVLQDEVDSFFDDALLGLVIPSAGVYIGVNL